jgi:ATP-dependent RNA helicase DeaD
MTNKTTFNDLGLSAKTLNAIHEKGFEEPTPIQIQTIPVMLRDESNTIAQAQTGTGKTAAFGLPLIEMIQTESRTVQALILVPTRELALQVSEEINSLKGDKDIKILPVYGGQSIELQLSKLKKGVHIVVGTPGRIIDHLHRKTLSIEHIEHLILDEADEMLNMGFIEDIEQIMQYTNQDKRTLLFSATIPKKIKELAHKYMDGYELLTVKKECLTSNLTKQIYFEVRASEKLEALCRVIDIEKDFYGLVFCRTKNDVDFLVTHLMDRGYDAEAIHGDISQTQRERTLEKFKKKRINILVATDVAARGIDVFNLSHVINYALPNDPESYVHRIGRTGRAGNQGTAITFITPGEQERLMFIKRVTKTNIKKANLPKVNDIIRAKKARINRDLDATIEAGADSSYQEWALNLLATQNAEEVLAGVLKYCFQEKLEAKPYGQIRETGKNGKQPQGKDRGRLFVALGKKDKINSRKLVELIKSRVSVKSKQITEILVLDKFSFLTVPLDIAEDIVANFKEKNQKSLITHAKKSG